MELRDLECFLSVARLGNFGRAAEARFMSPSALSRAIARLEEELGVPLFNRVGRTVQVNRYGALFRARVEEAFRVLDAGWAEVADAVDPERGIVTLAFMPTIGPTLVPRLMQSFRSDHPHIRFQLSQGGASAIVAMLQDGAVDLCLTAPDPKLEGIDWTPLWVEPMVLVAPADHPLAKRSRTVRMNQLASEPIVTLKAGFGIRQITDELFHEASANPTVVFEAADLPTARGLVAAGLGLAVLPPSSEAHTSGMPVELPIDDPAAVRHVGVAFMEDRYMPASARTFYEHMLDFARTDLAPQTNGR